MGIAAVTEDEAFIRAVVDNPGDDTPRLVYADWLNERDDPRGAYLRAEHAWAATHDPGDRETLRQMAKGLDPVWVARVSRPPVGVCCDHVRFSECGPKLTLADIEQVEQRLGGQFCVQFRAFLLNYNGGKADPPHLPYPEAVGPGWCDMDLELGNFYTASRRGEVVPEGVGSEWGFEIESERAWLDELHEGANPLISEMVPFAHTLHDLGYLLIGVGNDNNRGRVYHFRDYCHFSADPNHLFDYTTTFGEFLTRLRPERPPAEYRK
jgi:uncharacterized protein (TIGR02996 family)